MGVMAIRLIIVAGCLMLTEQAAASDTDPASRTRMDLSGAGWHLWLDRDAEWRNDALHLPGVSLDQLPVHAPSCGWAALYKNGRDVRIPGTVEEYLWDELGGDYMGVSWWVRDFDVADAVLKRRLTLEFASVRQRSEVFVNDVLVGYDAVGNTPFECDLTGRVRAGRNRIAVRVTDPGGNFDWRDYHVMLWGAQPLPMSHGFGGITGPVHLNASDAVRISDVFVRNTPAITDIDLETTVSNPTGTSIACNMRISVRDVDGNVVFDQTWVGERFESGDTRLVKHVTAPDANPWSPESPNLYWATIELIGFDRYEKRFGFRWFDVDGVGTNAMFRLNGKRIVLRSAISWGFWPVTGIFPSAELAKKNIESAKAMGLNMLNLHRCIGDPATFDAADELGLLLFEEPGGYTSRNGDEQCFAFAREKLLRMVKRDRSRPSLVIYNMINEETSPPEERHRRDMADAHQLDPTRPIVYTSGWAGDGEDPIKLNMMPLDATQRTIGWYDYHHAPGPGVYRDAFYNGPADYRWHRSERGEIVFWGEEGAIATPPRLEKIHEALKNSPNGWDGADYRNWFAAYERFLDEKNLRAYFPTVDALTEALGDVAFYYQGRIIENIRAGDTTDGYVINGWESEKLENHSGVVDCFRNPKGNPELLAYYNRPLLLAIKLRGKVGASPLITTCDVFIVNETNLSGTFELALRIVDPDGTEIWRNRFDVTLTGGDVYGELLLRDLGIAVDGNPGRYVLKGELRPVEGAVVGTDVVVAGHDEIYLVDRPGAPTAATGAVLDRSGAIRQYAGDQLNTDLPVFDASLPVLDYIVLGDGGDLIPSEPVPADVIWLPDGSGHGMIGDYYKGWYFEKHVFTRVDQGVQQDFSGRSPDPRIGNRDYSIRWHGKLRPSVPGPYILHLDHDDGARVLIDGREVIGNMDPFAAPRNDSGHAMMLEAGRDYDLTIEYFQSGGGSHMRLNWTTPAQLHLHDATIDELVRRVREDGTTLVIASNADAWAELFAQRGAIEYEGRMNHGRFWLGGNYFVRAHPLFDGLPVNCGMNWEYQGIVNYDRRRFGLRLKNEEVVVGCVTGNEHEVTTAVGLVTLGKGRVLFSTLDLIPLLDEPDGPADVARAILGNYLRYAAGNKGS